MNENSLPDRTYRYGTLQGQPEDTIRLLTIEPGCSDLITVHMSCARLSEGPTYTALSYVWGVEDPDNEIEIDGQILLIRSNLWRLLNRLQRQGDKIRVWADAMCVNQKDLQKRSQQVQLMSKIYGQAENVFAWLGDVDENLVLALRTSSECLPRNISSSTAWRHASNFEGELTYAIWNAVAVLASSVYWTRIWIVQEVVLSQDPLLLFGSTGTLALSLFYVFHRRAVALNLIDVQADPKLNHLLEQVDKPLWFPYVEQVSRF